MRETNRGSLAVRLLLLLTAANALLTANSALAGGYDVPTGAAASPLFGAQPFSQKMMRFEEFGLKTLPGGPCADCDPLPTPESCAAHTPQASLDAFLGQPLNPVPTKEANTALPNPWQPEIEQCIRPMAQTAIEGRPPGQWYSHQRWAELLPSQYFQSATRGARQNGGLRDGMQLHGWATGEFAPGGLYYAYAPGLEATNDGIDVRFHPSMPIQHPDALWTFDGTLPPKLLMSRYGFPTLFRHYNGLPIDPAANHGFGAHTLTTHEHNGHNPAESDGFMAAFFFPGQFFDYRWPMILAGHDRTNVGATDPRAATPDGAGGTIQIPGDWRETMSTHWFHDHMFDYTAQNVYKGSAAMNNFYSALDRGNEMIDCHYANPTSNVNLCLPSGSGLDWGNRDYDVNLLIAAKAWDLNGQLFFNIFNLDGFLGDRMTVNWLYKPYLEVRARRYRFRLLNGSVSRYLKLAIVDEAGNRIPFHLIANDGNIMEHSIPFVNQDLPTQAIAERYDIIIDFSQFEPGQKIYFINTMEHKDGKGPEDDPVPLAQILNGSYLAQGPSDFDPAVGSFLELRVMAYEDTDHSMNPADYEVGGLKMIPMPGFTAEELAGARHRSFSFKKGEASDGTPWTIRVDDELTSSSADPNQVSAAPDENSVEIWHLDTGGGWSHPVHIHYEEGQILTRDGAPPPLWERLARKDIYRLGSEVDSSREVSVALRFREFLGSYMEHCHNTQHEDHAMLIRYDTQHPGQTLLMPTPVPEWEGVFYEDSFGLASVQTGDPRRNQPLLSPGLDEDGDDVLDFEDNCKMIPNGPNGPNQLDTDGDDYGNICDPDLNNDGVVNFGDFSQFVIAFSSTQGRPNWNPDCDFNGDGAVNFGDFPILINYWGKGPGPSGIRD